MTKEVKLTTASTKVLDEFDSACRSWGWNEDQGTGKAVDRSKEDYLEAKSNLEKRISSLEKELSKLRQFKRLKLK